MAETAEYCLKHLLKLLCWLHLQVLKTPVFFQVFESNLVVYFGIIPPGENFLGGDEPPKAGRNHSLGCPPSQ